LSPDAGGSYALRIPHLFESLPQPRIGARGGFLILPGHQVAILRERGPSLEETVLIDAVAQRLAGVAVPQRMEVRAVQFAPTSGWRYLPRLVG